MMIIYQGEGSWGDILHSSLYISVLPDFLNEHVQFFLMKTKS